MNLIRNKTHTIYRNTKYSILNITLNLMLDNFDRGFHDNSYMLFMERHPNLQIQKMLALLRARGNISYDNLMYWFQELKDYLGEAKQADVLQDPSRIYNSDETGFPLAPKTKKVIASKHDKYVYQGGTTSNKTHITKLVIFIHHCTLCEALSCLPRGST